MVGFNYNGTDYYYRKNLQGDILAIVNASGSIVAQYDYDAWGTVLSVTGILASTIGAINPFRYRGYYYDTETKLYYLNSRYYDPEVGRFINADDVQYLGENGDFVNYNLFAYCANNPVKTVDENGKFWHIVIGAVIGAVVNVAVGAVSAALSGEEYSLEDGIKDAVVGALSGGLAATGFRMVGQAIGNAFISMGENAYCQIATNGFDNFDLKSMLSEGATATLFGALGGAGSGTKHLMSLGKQTVKRTCKAAYHRGLRAGFKEAKKPPFTTSKIHLSITKMFSQTYLKTYLHHFYKMIFF